MTETAYIATVTDRETGEVLGESDPPEYYDALEWAEHLRERGTRVSLRPFRPRKRKE